MNVRKVAGEKGYKLEPILMLNDYELAEMNSFKHVFKNIKVRGCHFHYTQAILKNIQAHKLIQEYSINLELKSWLNYLKALPFARPENVASLWEFLSKVRPLTTVPKDLDNFCSYFKNQWISNPKLSVFEWNHFDNFGARTTNNNENYNGKVNNYIDCPHPNIFSFINTFKGLETSAVLRYFGLKEGKEFISTTKTKDVNRNVRILQLRKSYMDNQISELR